MTPPMPSRRYRSLDGLRGVAALIVVFFHTLETIRPSLIAISGDHPLDPWTPYGLLMSTPLAILVAGSQSVAIFFVLSGFVLAMPIVSMKHFDWIDYYPRRLVRLYLPAIASLLLSVVLILAIPRHANVAVPGSWLVVWNALTVDPAQVLNEATLMNIVSSYNGPLWSLMFEVTFSLLLPAFIVIGILTARRWLFAVAATFLVIFVGRIGSNLGFYWLPPFFLGTLLALRLDVVISVAARVNRTRWSVLVWGATLVFACALIIAGALLPPGFFAGHLRGAAGSTLVILGAVLLVITAIASRGVARVLELRPIQWLGRISFSLYLVHVPILVSLAFLIGPSHWRLIAVVGIPLALLVGWLFSQFVELPSHRLSRRVGAAASRVGERFRAARSEPSG